MEKEPKKRRFFHRAELDDFHLNAAGEYIYTGPVHAWVSPRGKSLGKLWLCAGLAMLAVLAGGCIPGCAMEQRRWVLLPYLLALLSSGVQLWKVYRLTDGGDPVREYVWKASVSQLPLFGVLTSAFAAAAAAAELANLFLPGFSGRACAAVLFTVLALLALAASWLLRRTVRRLKWA